MRFELSMKGERRKSPLNGKEKKLNWKTTLAFLSGFIFVLDRDLKLLIGNHSARKRASSLLACPSTSQRRLGRRNANQLLTQTNSLSIFKNPPSGQSCLLSLVFVRTEALKMCHMIQALCKESGFFRAWCGQMLNFSQCAWGASAEYFIYTNLHLR